MSGMNGNVHYQHAGYDYRIVELRAVDATLTLAYEQRTTNLIALADMKRKYRTSGATAESTELIMIIEERLGLS